MPLEPAKLPLGRSTSTQDWEVVKTRDGHILDRHGYYQPSKIVDDNARICMWVDYKPIDGLLSTATKARKLQA